MKNTRTTPEKGIRTGKLLHYFTIMSLILVIGLLVPGHTVQAASKKSQALAAYRSFLTQKSINWNGAQNKVDPADCKFSMIYVDNNSVPELLLLAGGKASNHVAGFYSLYTFKNGKVVHIATARDGFCYYKKKGVFVTYTALQGEYVSYLKLAKGASAVKLRSKTYYSTDYYKGNSETKISKKTFKSELKKLVGSKKLTAPKFYENTAVNRTKYLK